MKRPVYHRRFGYDLNLLPNVHLQKLERGLDNATDALPVTGATIGYPGWGLLYYVLLSHLDPQRDELIVETGTNHGCTSIILAQALKDYGGNGQLMTFELENENVERAKSNIKAAGLEQLVQLHEGDSKKTLPEALKGASGIRFAFLDASHLYDDVKQEFEIVLPHLRDDAIVAFDNTYEIAEVDKGEDSRVNGFLKDIVPQYGGNLINFEFVSWFTPGFALWQKKPKL